VTNQERWLGGTLPLAARSGLPKRRSIDHIACGLFLLLLLKGLLWGAPSPGAQDPSLLIGRTVELIGRLQADARVFDTSCSALIDVDRIDGRRFPRFTEVVLRPCPNPPQQGWQLKLTGALKAPQSSVHPLVSGPASVSIGSAVGVSSGRISGRCCTNLGLLLQMHAG